MKILICGLPGSGKTTLAKCLYELLWDNGQVTEWFNADEIRAQYNVRVTTQDAAKWAGEIYERLSN